MPTSRRKVLKIAASAAAAFTIVPRRVLGGPGHVAPSEMVNIALIGYQFMGKAHSNAYRQVGRFFDLDVEPVMKVIVGRSEDKVRAARDKFGWQEYPRKHFESRFTKFFEGYWLPEKFGFDTRRVQYLSQILTGQMTREEALADLAQPPYEEKTIAQDFEYISTKLGISIGELQGYLDAPRKSYKDYKNQLYLFLLGARVMHAIGLEERAVKR